MKKNSKIFAAIALLIVAAAGVIIFEACNKKNEVLKVEQQIATRGDGMGIVYLEEVPDREAYILEFKKKLESAQNSDEYLTVANANSFMFDLLNYDFCNINDGRSTDVETSTYTLNVSDGVISLGEFAKLYSEISSSVKSDDYYYCIFSKIDDFDNDASTTNVIIKTVLASNYVSRDVFDPCDVFTATLYQWEDAADTLTKYLNLFKSPCTSGEMNRCYLINYRNHMFYYNDPYFNTHPNAPHLYLCGNCSYNAADISQEEMCELYWNYRDLACEYYYCAPCVLSYTVYALHGNAPRDGNEHLPLHHALYVEYADVECTNGNNY